MRESLTRRESLNRATLYAAREADDVHCSAGAWRKYAACWDTPVEVMFATGRRNVQEALNVCKECPVVKQCRDYALQFGELWGVWGGTTAAARRKMLSRRP